MLVVLFSSRHCPNPSITGPPSAGRGRARGAARGRAKGRNSASTSFVPQTTTPAPSGAPVVPAAHAGSIPNAASTKHARSAPNVAPAATNSASTTTVVTGSHRLELLLAKEVEEKEGGEGFLLPQFLMFLLFYLSLLQLAFYLPQHHSHLNSHQQLHDNLHLQRQVFGVRRSGRLKLGVIKTKAMTSDTIDLTTD